MRLAYKIALGLFAIGYATAFIVNPAAWILSGVCFTTAMCVSLLSFLNSDAQ